MAAVGDVMLGRGVGFQVARHGSKWPFAEAASTLRAADIAIANLEGPLTTRPASHGGIALPARPASASGLRTAGISILSLANNHSLDCGPLGVADTMRVLGGLGVQPVGAGDGERSAARPVFRTIKGLRLAFVSFLADMPGMRRPPSSGFTVALAGPGAVRKAVASARGRADIVVVSLHVGDEESSRPTAQQERLADEAVRSGADLTIMHHPHRLQALRVLAGQGGRPALIAYSLGNFVFDTSMEGDRDTVVLRCRFTKSGLASAEVIPFTIVDGRPTKPSPERAGQIMQRVAELSLEQGTSVDRGVVRLTAARPR